MVRESWVAKRARIRSASPYGHLASWDVSGVVSARPLMLT